MSKGSKNIIIVAAHPDDELLGCGGTIARLVSDGHQAFSLILGEGKTARSDIRDVRRYKNELQILKREANQANKIIGIKKVFFFDFPDNRFDKIPLLEIVKVIEKVKKDIKPDIIFTHHLGDLNIDHQITYRAVLTATRPVKDESVKEIYSFENPPSSEWNFGQTFTPDVYFNIENTLKKKIAALKEYKSEIRPFPHPRSLEGIKIMATSWGMKVGLTYAEAFKLVRIIK